MKYWVYINEKVVGPYDQVTLETVPGFTPQTLILSEEEAAKGSQQWVAASSIFDFDQVPLDQAAAQSAAIPAAGSADTGVLLNKLEQLTAQITNLNVKLDSMQSHLDEALEQNRKLAEQQTSAAPQTAPAYAQEDAFEKEEDSQAVFALPEEKKKETSPDTQEAFPEQAAPKEEELIIRSALDSIYGGEILQEKEEPTQVPAEDTFHDLVTGESSSDLARAEEEEAVQDIATHLRFAPVEEENKPGLTEEEKKAKEEEDLVKDLQEMKKEKEEEIRAIEENLEFTPLDATPQQPADEPEEEPAQNEKTVQQALITTPSADEAQKDALIKELTASAQEDVLDQIIQEHLQEVTTDSPAEKNTDIKLGAIATGAAAVGLATASAAAWESLNKKEEEAAPMAISTDKENPEKLEEVLPAEQMPADAPEMTQEQPAEPAQLPLAPQTTEQELQAVQEQQSAPQAAADLPEVEPVLPQEQTEPEEQPLPEANIAPMPQDLPQTSTQQEKEEEAKSELPSLDEQTPAQETPDFAQETFEELVPATQDAEPAPQAEQAEELPAEAEPAPQAEQAEELPAEKEPAPQAEQAEELPAEQAQEPTPEELPAVQPEEGNPNDLTEIELKEGSTYLISDFVPPAQLTDNVADLMKPKEKRSEDAPFQDILAASTTAQATQPLNTDGLPADLAATQVHLENTIQAKRGASLDIKTVPMVPEPENSQRLDMNDLDDVNTQHDLKTGGKMAKSTKAIIATLIALLLAIVAYVALAFTHVLPDAANVLSKKAAVKQQQPAQEELLQTAQPTEEVTVQEPPQPSAEQQALERVQNFPLPNHYALKAFIESKHAGISPELIEWEAAPAVEADNFSIIVRVPPENPQNFKMVYRFNYNTQTGLLEPTVSDAKNLLDEAYGKLQPAEQTAAPKASAATKRPRQQRRNTARKR